MKPTIQYLEVVPIRPLVCQRGIKLIEQITAGRMNLHAVKSRLLCPDCGSGKIMIY